MCFNLFGCFLDEFTWPTGFSFFLHNVNEDVGVVEWPSQCLICSNCEALCNWSVIFIFLGILKNYLVNVINYVLVHNLELDFVKPLFDCS